MLPEDYFKIDEIVSDTINTYRLYKNTYTSYSNAVVQPIQMDVYKGVVLYVHYYAPSSTFKITVQKTKHSQFVEVSSFKEILCSKLNQFLFAEERGLAFPLSKEDLMFYIMSRD